jgi:hypothetical protein
VTGELYGVASAAAAAQHARARAQFRCRCRRPGAEDRAGGAAGLPRLRHVRILLHTHAAVYLASLYYDIPICVSCVRAGAAGLSRLRHVRMPPHTAVCCCIPSILMPRHTHMCPHTATGTHPDLEEVLDANLQYMCREILFDPSFSGQVSVYLCRHAPHTPHTSIYLYICLVLELLVDYILFGKAPSVAICMCLHAPSRTLLSIYVCVRILRFMRRDRFRRFLFGAGARSDLGAAAGQGVAGRRLARDGHHAARACCAAVRYSDVHALLVHD